MLQFDDISNSKSVAFAILQGLFFLHNFFIFIFFTMLQFDDILKLKNIVFSIL